MATTKEQWDLIEKELSGTYGRAELICDGYKVIAQIEHIAALRQGIMVYVNGVLKVKWIDGKAEEGFKFHREVKHYLYSAKQREEAKSKARSRRLSTDLREFYQEVATSSISTWVPYWTNAKAFIRHLRKTCSDVQIVKLTIQGEA